MKTPGNLIEGPFLASRCLANDFTPRCAFAIQRPNANAVWQEQATAQPFGY